MTVQVLSLVDGSISIVPWDAGKAMSYSYYNDAYILEGDMFICCNQRAMSCCNFQDEQTFTMCDAIGPVGISLCFF